MTVFQSPYFGDIAYQPDSVVEFPRGLPGFENEREFLLIQQPVNKPLVFLQSLARAELCFATLPLGLISAGYKLSLSEEERAALGLVEPSPDVADPDLACLAVVSLAEDQPPTANLLSPIVIHWRLRRAVQSVPVHSSYSHRHPLVTPAMATDANRQESGTRQETGGS